MDIDTTTNRIITLLTEQKANKTITVDDIRLKINDMVEEYVDSKFKSLNSHNVVGRSEQLFCDECTKRKKMKGDGTIESLCECCTDKKELKPSGTVVDKSKATKTYILPPK